MEQDKPKKSSFNDILFYSGMAGLGITIGYFAYRYFKVDDNNISMSDNEKINILDIISESNSDQDNSEQDDCPCDPCVCDPCDCSDDKVKEGKQEIEFEVENIANLIKN